MSSSFIAVRLAFSCPECGGPIPLNRVVPELLCHHCLSPVDPTEAWPTDVFDRCWDEHPRLWPIGARRKSINLKLSVKVEAEHVAALPPGLGARAADAFATRVFPGVVTLHGEADATFGPSATASAPILFACLGCGAGLKVDGSSRVVACTYCSESCFLPDDLWLRMHPVIKRRWIHLAL